MKEDKLLLAELMPGELVQEDPRTSSEVLGSPRTSWEVLGSPIKKNPIKIIVKS